MCSPLYLAIHDDFHVTMHFPVGMKPSEAWFKQRNHSTHRLNQYPIYLVSIHETSRGLRAIPGQKHPFLPWYGTGDFGINYLRHTVSAIFQQYRETANCHDMDSKRLHLICGTNCATLGSKHPFSPWCGTQSRTRPLHKSRPAICEPQPSPRPCQSRAWYRAKSARRRDDNIYRCTSKTHTAHVLVIRPHEHTMFAQALAGRKGLS